MRTHTSHPHILTRLCSSHKPPTTTPPTHSPHKLSALSSPFQPPALATTSLTATTSPRRLKKKHVGWHTDQHDNNKTWHAANATALSNVTNGDEVMFAIDWQDRYANLMNLCMCRSFKSSLAVQVLTSTNGFSMLCQCTVYATLCRHGTIVIPVMWCRTLV
jgi:hypothetical protein